MLVNSFMLRLLNFSASSVPSRARQLARGCALQVCAGFLTPGATTEVINRAPAWSAQAFAPVIPLE